jgi:hypothetical protein
VAGSAGSLISCVPPHHQAVLAARAARFPGNDAIIG